MPRYHFNINDGADSPDWDGSEMPNIGSARVAAVRFVGECLRDSATQFWGSDEWRLNVTDERGATLFSIMVRATDAPDIVWC